MKSSRKPLKQVKQLKLTLKVNRTAFIQEYLQQREAYFKSIGK